MPDAKDPERQPKTGQTLVIEAHKGESAEQSIARVALSPILLAANVLADLHKSLPDVELMAFLKELAKHADAAKVGDLSRQEEMLVAQSHTLDALFYSMVRRSRDNSAAGYLDAAETYMKLGLRAQSQCRATVESLAAIKNPAPVAFVRQANISAGPQQVNNGVSVSSRAGEHAKTPNKLLESDDGKRLDTRTAGDAGRINPQLETVGTVIRAENNRGQG
jgi:hypothetical protein